MKNITSVTAQELIEALQELPPDTQVAFASDYGDHSHTQQVHLLRGEVERRSTRESAYSDSGLAVDNDSDTSRKGPELFIIS